MSPVLNILCMTKLHLSSYPSMTKHLQEVNGTLTSWDSALQPSYSDQWPNHSNSS
jgi:hypothetical protein